ncbi:MAG TPA: peptidoglycan DD-metalloendopeptidase family protein [Oligoflexia bacterium]|mgnify:CR=1 FL=1|nr:peptidoglycan DD-metalloendopeptidase family protein [Oligoflexia bacterium]HMP48857.1 peptidoglycan DD-metalloendopeptidase family protein [Oligoflexia bacterium]
MSNMIIMCVAILNSKMLKYFGVFSLLLLVMVVLLIKSVVAQSYSIEQIGRSDSVERDLKQIRIRIQQTEAELKGLKKEASLTSEILEGLNVELKKLRKEESDSVQMLGSLASQIEGLGLQINDVNEQIVLRRVQVKERLSSMYKTRRRLSPLSFLFLSSGVQSFYRRADYLRRLVVNDGEQIAEFEMLLETLRSSTEEFALLKKEEEKTLKRVREARELIAQKQLEQARVSRELVKKLDQKTVTLSRYREEAQRLEELLQGMMGGIKPDTSVPSDISPVPLPVFAPGRLPFPVKGTIVQHFGKQKHDEFADTIFVKGIEVASIAGSPVSAVSEGLVVFNSELPVFGNVLIVEHPGRFFTLYGRILPLKAVGDKIEPGDIIARTSEPDTRGRNFYFELRKEGKPQNPEKFFKK